MALVILGLTVGPLFLLRPEVEQLRLGNLRVQLYAGFLYWTVGAVLMIGPFLAIATLPGEWFERWWGAITGRVMAIPDRTFAIMVVGAGIAFAAALANFSFGRGVSTADGVAQVWQAKILLSGRLTLPADPNPEFFAVDNVIDRPWMSQFPIGGPLVLLAGVFARATWLVNPVMIGVVVFGMYRFVGRVYGEAQARAAAVVIITSPMILIMGGSHMNHVPTMACIALALAALPTWVTPSTPAAAYRSAAVIGASVGTAMMIRPLDGLVAGLVFGIFMLMTAGRQPGLVRARSLLVAFAAGAVPVALLLGANWATTGRPLQFGYQVLWGPNHTIGLHPDPVGHPHTAWRALNLALKYLVQVNWVATAWPVPVLLVVAIGLLFAQEHNRWDALLLSHFCAQLVAYALYWHDGQFVGPRFLFSAVPGLLVLAARAPFLVSSRIHGGTWRRVTLVAVPLCVAASWIAPMQPFGGQAMATEYRELRRSFKVPPPEEMRRGTLRNALVFIQEGAGSRLTHRLWGVGVSHADAARLFERSDACSLLEAVRAEETLASGDSVTRLLRIAGRTRPFTASTASFVAEDVNFRVTDSTSVTPVCEAEMAHDRRLGGAIAYGPMMLRNQIDAQGRVGGDVVFVMDLRDRNELLRARFGGRRWYRYEIPRGGDGTPVLVPYETER